MPNRSPVSDPANDTLVSGVLRVGVAGCFIGHGAFGLITKAAWVPYFGVVGIGESAAWQLMPLVGIMDIVMGVLVLTRPCRALFVWAVIWTIWTALLRPLSGEPIWEAIERAGNYGVPVAVLVLVGWHRPWFARLPSGWSGFLAPEGDAAGLAAHIRRIADDPGTWPAISLAARRRVETEFNNDILNDRLFDRIIDLLVKETAA